MGDSFACVVESEFLPPFRGQPIGAKEPFTPFLRMEWGEITQRVKLYYERTDLTRYFQLFTGRAVIFPSKAPFHHSLHRIKRQAKSEIYTFWKVFSIENTISGQKYS